MERERGAGTIEARTDSSPSTFPFSSPILASAPTSTSDALEGLIILLPLGVMIAKSSSDENRRDRSNGVGMAHLVKGLLLKLASLFLTELELHLTC